MNLIQCMILYASKVAIVILILYLIICTKLYCLKYNQHDYPLLIKKLNIYNIIKYKHMQRYRQVMNSKFWSFNLEEK